MTTTSTRGGRTGIAVLLALVGGVGMVGSATGAWVVETVDTTIADVPRVEEVTTAGVEFAGFILPVGVLAAAAGLLLVVAKGRLRLALSGIVGICGLIGLGGVIYGLSRALTEPGAVGASAWFALLSALATIASGVVALRPAPPVELSGRYDLDAEDPAASEWRMASAEDDDVSGQPDDLA